MLHFGNRKGPCPQATNGLTLTQLDQISKAITRNFWAQWVLNLLLAWGQSLIIPRKKYLYF